MTKNKNIYKGLECSCNEFEKIPIERRELGMSGVATSYTLSIGGALADYKMDKYLDAQNTSKGIKALAAIKMTTNFGILSYLVKKAEGKSNERAGTETTIETGVSYIAIKTGVSLLTRIATGATAGAAVGSAAPIVGTIIGAVAGALIAGVINDAIFAEEDSKLAKDKAENERIERLEKEYKLKIDRINDYLIRNHYIELRILNELESENLCKEISNLNSSYFKTILLMLSFSNYLDRDKEFYDTLQEKALDTSKDSKETNKTESKQLQIKPIADSISIKLEIQECYDSKTGNLLTNTTIYIYNHRFQRVVAKGTTDSKASLKIENVSVGKEIGIDKLSFIVDRDNLSERVA